jgi:uncharacterized protein (DUF1697 family)
MSDNGFVALLRGINVGRGKRIPMADLRTLCERLGWTAVRTYIQSGNVIFRAEGTAQSLSTRLENALPPAFGVTASVITISTDELVRHSHGNPFSEESRVAPNLVLLALSKEPPADDALDELRRRAGTERLERVGDALWIHYADGAGRSRLTPGLLDRAIRSPTTTRNWRTVMKLVELAGDDGP